MFKNAALIGLIAGALTFIQVVPYIISILRGHTKPERTSYLIWLFVNIVSVSSYISAGARTTIWTGVVITFTGFIIFLLSIKYGMGGFSSFDKLCLLLALSGILVWLYSNNSVVALYFMTFVGIIGYLPTIKKTYFLPKTENLTSWSLTALASIVNLFAATSIEFKILAPISIAALLQSTVVLLILFPKRRSFHVRDMQSKIHTFLSHPLFAK